MRRFSQRSYLVTLSEINITPLLDLAFVLLIIFVITTPLLEQSINLKLPRGGRPEQTPNKRDVRTVEVSITGVYALDRQRMRVWTKYCANWRRNFGSNPEPTIVYIRADKDRSVQVHVAAVIDGCQRIGITRYSLRTEPTK